MKVQLTHVELCEELEKIDEVTLLELLGISSTDLVSHFQDRIEEDFERLTTEVDEYREEEYTEDE